MSAPKIISLLLSGAKRPKRESGPPKRSRRDALRVAMRDFRQAKSDDEAMDAMLNFSDLARGVSRD